METVQSVERKFLKAADVAQILQVSETTAYRIIRKLNDELKKQGKIIVAGKISRKYFEEKVYL
ncbi:helix-turn-helix domain-containing protein [Paenibacillus lentus]|uniref:Helix-turn-helix domain-containing protein n=1 Tax=Paenibacillus lentus TaxID=1338368 RepID=A0A3Q8S8L0_9BACL|nr:helix-turn-helix domain-containing protein [Paenibacillus lentus]AZK44801.1 helix-turn-helix domain-containing protein [Paenibacillus lentus]